MLPSNLLINAMSTFRLQRFKSYFIGIRCFIDNLQHVYVIVNTCKCLTFRKKRKFRRSKGRVSPIFSNSEIKDLGNYRPISGSPCLSKILERII